MPTFSFPLWEGENLSATRFRATAVAMVEGKSVTIIEEGTARSDVRIINS